MEQRSSRFEYLFEIGQLGMKSLIKEPVRESVREALAEERSMADDREVPARRPDEEEETGGGSRILRMAAVLPVLGVVAAGALLTRQWLMNSGDEKGTTDRSDRTSSPLGSGKKTAAGTDPTETGGSSSHGDHGDETGGSTGHGDHSDEVGDISHRTYGDDSDDVRDSIGHEDYGGVESEE